MDGMLVLFGAIIIGLHFSYLCLCYIMATIKVTMYVFSTNLIYITTATLLPFAWWAISTKRDEWNFYARKKLTLRVCILNALFTVSQVMWMLVFKTAVIKMTAISTGRNFTVSALLNLCRLTLVLSTIGVDLLIYFKVVEDNIFGVDRISESINQFTLTSIVDTRENKENLYDLNILKEIEHGKRIPIKEHDRFVHQFFLGASGTGKTSTTLLPAIICDLNNKYDNAKRRMESLYIMLKKKEACIVKPDDVENPDESDITEWWVQGRKRIKTDSNGEPVSPPVSKKSKEFREYKQYSELYQRQVARIRKKYGDCGITVMAPNNSLNDDVIKAAAARGIKVNVIDPAKKYDPEEFPNVHQIGINPFYVPYNLSATDRQKEIADKADTFANVLLAVSEIHGIGDQYFRDINESVTTNVATVCMLNANLEHRQTSIPEVQKCINDFGCLTDMVNQIQTALHMKVVVGEIAPKKNDRRNIKDNNKTKSVEKKREEEQRAEDEPIMQKSGMFFDEEAVRKSKMPDKYAEQGMSVDEYVAICRKEAENYYETLHFVLSELLGAGNEKMFDQARGLRNIINRILQNPDVKDILSAQHDFLDWDEALREGQITVINTALELGQNASTALGILVMLLMKHSVVRRPKKARMNHFLYIDEAAQYMHPMYEDFFALYRQYGVACTIAMQSLSQFEKSPVSKYLRGVIMEAGIHIVFGRLTPDEMKTYEALSGLTTKEVVQVSENANSEFDENYSITRGQRTSLQEEATINGTKTRMRQFREVTVYMIDEGNVKDGFVAKVQFSQKSDFTDRPEVKYNFAQFAEFELTDITEEEEKRRVAEQPVEKYETDYHYRTKDISSPIRDSEVPVVKGEGRLKTAPRRVERKDSSDAEGKKADTLPDGEETKRRLRMAEKYRQQLLDGEDITSFRSPQARATYQKKQDAVIKARQEAEKAMAYGEEEEDDGISLTDTDVFPDENKKTQHKPAVQDAQEEQDVHSVQKKPVIEIPDGMDDMDLLSLASGGGAAGDEDNKEESGEGEEASEAVTNEDTDAEEADTDDETDEEEDDVEEDEGWIGLGM